MDKKIREIEEAQKLEGKNRESDIEEKTIQPEEKREIVTDLKVKADHPDISSDDRKRNVKKLAGAVSHSWKANGEINVRCFGNASIGKASKAIAIARRYVETSDLQLSCSPAFITTKIGENELTGICFCTFATKRDDETPVDIENIKSFLMVKADDRNISSDDRRTNVKKLAGAISHSLEENKECIIRCFGNATIGKASKALAIARGYTATRGADLYCWPIFIVADMNGSERTGIAFYAYTNDL